jgi:predicted nucleic acid-binding protein
MILLDTGYFLALVRPRDALFPRAQTWAQAVSGEFLVTEYVLWETANALSQPAERPKFHALLARLQSSPVTELLAASPELWQAGVQLHAERIDKEWSLTDCISFLVMWQRGIVQALAYDHHFEQAGFEALLRRDPL